jgi:FkbM family methyltransferase
VAHRVLAGMGVRVSRIAGGIQVARLAPWERARRGDTVQVWVAGRSIDMYASSYLAHIYSEYPDYAGELARLLAVVRQKYPDAGLVDVGASYGDTVAIAKSVADLPVIAVEGDEASLELLRRNMPQFRDVEIVPTLLGDREGSIRVRKEDDGGNLRLVPDDASGTATLSTLDALVAGRADRKRYRLLKIDTEGFDCRIVRGGLAYIGDVRPVIMMEYHPQNMRRLQERGIDTLRMLVAQGYDRAAVFDNGGRLVAQVPLDPIDILEDLDAYATGPAGIFYYDLCLFHAQDGDLAMQFARAERERRGREVAPATT